MGSLKSPGRPSRPVPSTSISSMGSLTASAGNTPQEIQSHLYDAFLSGDTADISLWIHGDEWDLGYRLHRIVLTQAVSTGQCPITSNLKDQCMWIYGGNTGADVLYFIAPVTSHSNGCACGLLWGASCEGRLFNDAAPLVGRQCPIGLSASICRRAAGFTCEAVNI